MFVFSNRGRGVVQKMSNFSAISWREQFTFDKKLMSTLYNVVLEQLWEVYFYSASSLIQCFTPLWNSILADSELVSLAFNPRGCVVSGEAAHTNFSLWCDPSGDWTIPDLLYSNEQANPFITETVPSQWNLLCCCGCLDC